MKHRRGRRSFKSTESGFRGVTKHSRGWRARITVDYEMIHLGSFSTAEDAAAAYDKAAIERYGPGLAITNAERKAVSENK